MSWKRFLGRTEWDRERSAEIESHIQIDADDNIARGMRPAEARAAALRKFGNTTLIREEIYRMNTITFLDTLAGDLRYGLRLLARSPMLTAAVLLTLAIGIGGNAAIFAVIDGILLRPLAYPHAEALVSIWHTGFGSLGPNVNCSPSMYFTYREENRTFQQFGLWWSGGASVTGIGEPELPRALFVTYGVLDALGVKPLLGRWFSQLDDTAGSPETVMLTYGYWQRRFGGDQSIVGRTLTINRTPHTVIGVMPEEFRFQHDPELILPQRFERNKVFLGEFSYRGIARLKPGVTMQQANADLAHMLPIWLNTWPPPPGFDLAIFRNARLRPAIQPLSREVVGDIGTALWVVMGTLILVLLIACANVANLLLVRAEGRQHELAIRAALGAGWGRIARQMLLESTALGIVGGALGLGFAYVALRILVAKGPATLPRLDEIRIDPLVLLFTLGASLLSGALFGVIPVFKCAGPRIPAAVRSVSRTFSQTRESHHARSTLVVVQVALAVVLLISSGLMIRTFQQLRNVRPGFTHPEQIQILHAAIPETVDKNPGRVMHSYNEILDKLAAIPGVAAVGLASAAPLESLLGFRNINPLYAQDKASQPGQVTLEPEFRFLAPGFFRTMGTRLLAGRDFTWADLYQEHHVAIISENLARDWWGSPRAALGKRVREGSIAPWREVVGVVENVYENGMQVKPPEFAYLPALMDRYLIFDHEFVIGTGMFAIRSSRPSEHLLAQERQAIWSVNGRQPVFLVNTLQALYDQSMARTSFTLVMLAIAGAMALLLGIIGIYGVIAYAVSQRTREIGIRIAVGARPAELLGMFLRHALLLAALGAALGLPAAAILTRLLSSLLFGVNALDPLTYSAASALLITAAVLASYLPARRAIGIDPVESLRAE
jgi:putative ABC transport system permease protein